MTNDDATDQAAEIPDEIETIRQVYFDIATFLPPNKLEIKLIHDIRVIFILPEGYPESASPKHEVKGSNRLSSVKNEIDEALNNFYNKFGGFPILFTCIPMIMSIAEKHRELLTVNSKLKQQEEESYYIPDLHQNPTSSKEIKVEKTVLKPKRFNWFTGEPIKDRKSTFQAHLVEVKTKDDAMDALSELKENNKIAVATHNIYVYSVKSKGEKQQMDCEDDGETGAGARLMNMLRLMKIENMLVVVTRWYGGIHLGPDRFSHINNVARELIVQYRQTGQAQNKS